MRALPHLGPQRTLRFVALPEGQDPDDVVSRGGRAAIEALLEKPEPLVDRLWRHEVEAAPLDTPEARAGLKARLMDHVQAIGDPNVRQLYRDEWLRRFDALVRPQAQQQGQSRDALLHCLPCPIDCHALPSTITMSESAYACRSFTASRYSGESKQASANS